VRGMPLMGVDPDGRFFFVPILIAMAAAAVIAAATNYAQQQQASQMSGMEIDPWEVAGAAAIGATAAGVGVATGGLAAPAIAGLFGTGAGAAAAGAIIGGGIGGAAAGGTSYSLGSLGRNRQFTWKGLGLSVAIGGAAGAAGGLSAGMSGSVMERAITGGALSTGAGMSMNYALTGQSPTGIDFAGAVLSTGVGAAVAGYSSYASAKTVGRTPAPAPVETESTAGGPSSPGQGSQAAESAGTRPQSAAPHEPPPTRLVLNVGGEGEVPGALNVQGRWVLDPSWRSSQGGQTLEALQAQGHEFHIVDDMSQLPFKTDSAQTVHTNSVPLDRPTFLGPSPSSSDISRVLGPGGQWFNNGSLWYQRF
jgi:hypothetical protein